MMHFIFQGAVGWFENGAFTLSGSTFALARLEASLQREFAIRFALSDNKMAGSLAVARTMLEAKDAVILEATQTPSDVDIVY